MRRDDVILTPEEMQKVIYSVPVREPGEDYSRLMEATMQAAQRKLMKLLEQFDVQALNDDGSTYHSIGIRIAPEIWQKIKEITNEQG